MSKQPTFVRHFADLAALPESETHRIEIDEDWYSGWIIDKRNPSHRYGHYLSTHTFYSSEHKHSTELLRSCGFNVTCANWDAPAFIAKEGTE